MYDNKIKLETVILQLPGSGIDSVQVSPRHKYRGNYFCPTYCAVVHKHLIHPKQYNCGNTECNHFKYIIIEEPEHKIKVVL